MTHPPRKRWGQHFLADTNLLHKLVKVIDPQPEDIFLEIGPGEGALTELLISQIRRLVAVEIDSALARSLTSAFPAANCLFHQGDILKVNFAELGLPETGVRVVGNIPYNITTPILFRLLGSRARWKDIHLMVQKEVAERLAAEAGSRAYGRLTVMVAQAAEVRREVDVPPEVFVPRPAVHSSFIHVQFHDRHPMDSVEFRRFSSIIRTAFGQRRKMLRNSLRSLGLPEDVEIDLSRRPETLTVEDFLVLTRASLVQHSG